MSAVLLPMRLVVKEMMAGWCAGAGIPVDLSQVSVTDLDGRRANALRSALREIERSAKAAHDAALAGATATTRAIPQEYHEWHDRAIDAADQAFALAAAAASLIIDGLDTPDRAILALRRHPLVGRVWRILRSAIAVCALTRWEGMEEMTIRSEALASDLRDMLTSAPVGPHRSDGSERVASAPVAVAVPAGVMTVQQVAEHLGLSLRTVQDYRLDGRLPAPRMIGRTPVWTRQQIDEWQAQRPGPGRWGPRR